MLSLLLIPRQEHQSFESIFCSSWERKQVDSLMQVGDIVSLRPEWKVAAVGTAQAAKAETSPTKSQQGFGFGYGVHSDSNPKQADQDAGKDDQKGGFDGFGFGGASENDSRSEKGVGGFGFGEERRKDEGGMGAVEGLGFGSIRGAGRDNVRGRSGTEERNGRSQIGEIIGLAPGGGEVRTFRV